MEQSKVKFNFRQATIKDEEGKVIGKSEKKPAVELEINLVTVDDVLAIIEAGGKQVEMLLDAANSVILQAVRGVFDDAAEGGKEVNQELVDANADKLSWEAIANRPKAERTGGGIASELFEAFAEDYKAVMATVMEDKTPEQIATAAAHLAAKFSKCRFNKPAIATLRTYLATWFTNTPNADDFAEVYAYLDNRAETLLTAESKLVDAI